MTPARSAAAKVSGYTLPSLMGGVTITIRFEPATFAGIMFIRTEEG